MELDLLETDEIRLNRQPILPGTTLPSSPAGDYLQTSRTSPEDVCTTRTPRSQYRIFNRTDVVAEGWYWLLPSAELNRGAVRAVNILDYELAVFRGADGLVSALDAYCPHMGAHLAEGKVEDNQLRCFFHNWCFDASGKCTDIPCLGGKPRISVSTRSWHVREHHGLVWIWLGEGTPSSIPTPPELIGVEIESSLGNHFIKNCHPNVVMINAIDEQHFQTVHRLPGHILHMDPVANSLDHISFFNTGMVPATQLIGRLLKSFYKNVLTYNLDYWSGSTGTVTLGPDFLHLYLMFALRQTREGKTEGYAVVFTKKRLGFIGAIINSVVLFLTKLAGLYFAHGDTRVFQTIKFNFATPIAADRAVISFIHHLEQQREFSRHIE